jgi:hypothetical protein
LGLILLLMLSRHLRGLSPATRIVVTRAFAIPGTVSLDNILCISLGTELHCSIALDLLCFYNSLKIFAIYFFFGPDLGHLGHWALLKFVGSFKKEPVFWLICVHFGYFVYTLQLGLGVCSSF